MTQPEDYPETVLEVIDDGIEFRPRALRAVREFAEAGPWRGSLDERREKFRRLNKSLAEVYGIVEPSLRFGLIDGSCSGGSHYMPALHQITLVGKLSVVTYLHEFAHARGMGERGACRWSINLFRRVFPRQFARLVGRAHMLIMPASIQRRNGRAMQGEQK